MPYDNEKFVERLSESARGKTSSHKCATFVRKALEAGGADTRGHQESAKTYGPILQRNGFHEITVEDPETFAFQRGDIVVIQNYKGGSIHGHIAGFNGTNWVSDFVQNDFWPNKRYEMEHPNYVVYRR
ncbi:MAG: peptidoglycan amidohydrolase family protein [Pseudomonadota bacterium]